MRLGHIMHVELSFVLYANLGLGCCLRAHTELNTIVEFVQPGKKNKDMNMNSAAVQQNIVSCDRSPVTRERLVAKYPLFHGPNSGLPLVMLYFAAAVLAQPPTPDSQMSK